MSFNTIAVYEGDGSTNAWTVPFSYLKRDYVKVFIDGVEDTSFTWLTSSSVAAASIPAGGAVVTVKRVTPRTGLTVTIGNTGSIRGSDINTQSLQALHVVEEGYDALVNALSLDTEDDTFDAQSKIIKNVATPTADSHAATKAYVDAADTALVATAAAYASAAATSASAASTSATTAASSASAASASATAAATAETNAGTAQTAAEAAQTAAEAAQAAAEAAAAVAASVPASAIDNDSTVTGVFVADALETLDAAIAALSSATTTALAGKADSVHTHAISAVTGLQTALDAKAPLASPAFTSGATIDGNTVVHAGNISSYAAPSISPTASGSGWPVGAFGLMAYNGAGLANGGTSPGSEWATLRCTTSSLGSSGVTMSGTWKNICGSTASSGGFYHAVRVA